VSAVRILYGELRSGKITGEIDATGYTWAQTLNDAGYIDEVRIPDRVVRDLQLDYYAEPGRCFLAAEVDDRIQEAGPIWTENYDWEKGQYVLGAAGLWSLFDARKVLPVLVSGQRVQDAHTTVAGTDFGGIGRDLVAQAMTHVGGDLPIVLPVKAAGGRTETFYGWQMAWVGEQLRQLTQRENGPDIRFRPRRNPDDRRYLQWVLEHGSEIDPRLTQIGADWVFDATTTRSPVLGIGVAGNARSLGSRAWVTGNGQEAGTLIATDYDPALIDRGLPLLERAEPRWTVEQQATLDGHARNLRARSARRPRVWKVTVHASAARDVQPGDYARVAVRDHPVLGAGEARLRVRKKSGSRNDRIVLDMYPLQ
jgi:YD repeat-containing protein